MTFDKMRSGKRDSIVLSRFLPLKDILKLEIVSDPEFSKIFFKSFNGQVPKIKYVNSQFISERTQVNKRMINVFFFSFFFINIEKLILD